MSTVRRRTIGAAAALSAAALTATACTGGSGGSPSAGATGKAVQHIATNQVTTGTATTELSSVTWFGDYRPLISLDPLRLADYPEETIIPNVCEPMIRVAPNYALSPGLVSWKFTTPTQLQLAVRPKVTFTDGTPMTATDVAYSLNRNLDPAVASNYAYAFGNVQGITAQGTSTVVVSLKRPQPNFVNTLATLAGAVVEKRFTVKAGKNFGSPKTGVVCTGPFAFKSYDGTSTLVLVRNEHYWDPAHKAKAARFTFVFPVDPSAIANGFTSGRMDGGFDVPINLIKTLKSATNGKLYVGGAGSTPVNIDLLMSKTTGAGADPRVRRAMSMVFDRKAIASTIYGGAADPLYAVSGPGLWGYAKDQFQAAYQGHVTSPDVGAAKKLVAAAGATGKSLAFCYPAGDPTSVQLATVLQQEAAQIGLKLKLVGLPNQQYGSLFSDPKARAPYDLLITKNYVELPDPLTMDQLYGTAGGATNFSGYDNKTVATDLANASAASTPTERARLVIAAEKQLAQDLPSIPIVTPRAVVFQNSRVTGAPLTFSFMTSPWAAAIGGH
jgi:peptide/nickel transport system substrate-binding protein